MSRPDIRSFFRCQLICSLERWHGQARRSAPWDGQDVLRDHVAIAVFRKLIEDCYVSDLRIDGARGRQEAGHGGRSARSGDDLVVAAKYIFDNYPDIFQEIIKKIGERIPGVEKIEAQATQDMNAAAIGATSR